MHASLGGHGEVFITLVGYPLLAHTKRKGARSEGEGGTKGKGLSWRLVCLHGAVRLLFLDVSTYFEGICFTVSVTENIRFD